MQIIRRKIRLIIVLLVVAFAVSTVIYERDGFSIAGPDDKMPGCATMIAYSPGNLANDPLKGESLFKANCTSCHGFNTELVGPALIGLPNRVPKGGFIEMLLLEPKKAVRTSVYAKALCKQYGDKQHMSFKDILTKEDVEKHHKLSQGVSCPADARRAGCGKLI